MIHRALMPLIPLIAAVVLTGCHSRVLPFDRGTIAKASVRSLMIQTGSPTREDSVTCEQPAPLAELAAVLRSAEPVEDHKCAAVAELTLAYADGSNATLELMPGHDDSSYEFRFGHAIYRVNREALLTATERMSIPRGLLQPP